MMKDDLSKAKIQIAELKATIKELRRNLKIEGNARSEAQGELHFIERVMEHGRDLSKSSTTLKSAKILNKSKMEMVADSVDEMSEYCEKHKIDLERGVIDIDEN